MKKHCFINLFLIIICNFISSQEQNINNIIPIEILSFEDQIVVKNIIDNLAVNTEYKGNRFRCDQNTFNLLLDNLPLSSSIWRAYNFAPPYLIKSKNHNEFYIEDGVRLKGVLKLVYKDISKRIYIAHGTIKFDKTIVKIEIEGDAIIIVENYISGNEINNNIYVHAKFENTFWKYLSKISYTIFKRFIDNRINNIIKDTKAIAYNVYSNPKRVLFLLKSKNGNSEEILKFENVFIKSE